MKKAYQLLLVLGANVTLLSSCSRGGYAVNQQPLVNLRSQQTTVLTTQADLATMARVVGTAAPMNLQDAVDTTYSGVVVHKTKQAAILKAAVHSHKVTRNSLVQRLALAKLTKQLSKNLAVRHNTANIEHTTSKVGNAALVLLASLVIILIGGLIGGANIIVTIGGIVFVVGLILLIVALINK